MFYSDFKLTQLIKGFGLSLNETSNRFADIPIVEPSPLLTDTLHKTLDLAIAINTEKACSEMIITPILLEIRRHFHYQISLFSGTDFTVDPDRGLSGICDFILSKAPEQLFIRAPVVAIVEAKNENLKSGLPQCIAAMIAAQIFNQQEQNDIASIYGVITIGTIWHFLKLTQTTLDIDLSEYYPKTDLPKILGILIHALQ